MSKWTQQLPKLLAQRCWELLLLSHEALESLTGFKLCATTPNTFNNMQQGVQMDSTCNIQQCWELLANNVVSVCTGLNINIV